MKQPRVISLENVKQILHWGPLVAKRCKSTGRVIKLGGVIAEPGEVVPVSEQFWYQTLSAAVRLGLYLSPSCSA